LGGMLITAAEEKKGSVNIGETLEKKKQGARALVGALEFKNSLHRAGKNAALVKNLQMEKKKGPFRNKNVPEGGQNAGRWWKKERSPNTA